MTNDENIIRKLSTYKYKLLYLLEHIALNLISASTFNANYLTITFEDLLGAMNGC